MSVDYIIILIIIKQLLNHASYSVSKRLQKHTWECRVNATIKLNVKNDGTMQSKTEVAGVRGSRE